MSPNNRPLISALLGSETIYTFTVKVSSNAGESNQASITLSTNQPPTNGEFIIRALGRHRAGEERAMETLFNVVVSSAWVDDQLPLSYRYRAAENRFPQLSALALTEGYVPTPKLSARTLPYFDANGTMVVVSVRDALGAISTCGNQVGRANKEKMCPSRYLQPPAAKSADNITASIEGLRARINGGFLSEEVALTELHAEVSQINAIDPTTQELDSKQIGEMRAQALNVLDDLADIPQGNVNADAQDSVSMAVPLLTQVRNVVDTEDVAQTAPLAAKALDVTERLLESRPLAFSAGSSENETAALGSNVVKIVSSLSTVVVAQSDTGRREGVDPGATDQKEVATKPLSGDLRLRLGEVVDTLCRVVTDSAVPDSAGLHESTDRVDIHCQKQSPSESRKAIVTDQAARGPALDLQWKPQPGQNIAASSPFIAAAFHAHPAVTLPPGAIQQLDQQTDQTRRRRLLVAPQSNKLVQLRLQLGITDVLQFLDQSHRLRLTLVSNKPLHNSTSNRCQIRGQVQLRANGFVYGGTDARPSHSVLHSVFVDFVENKQRRLYKTEQLLANLEIISGDLSTSSPTTRASARSTAPPPVARNRFRSRKVLTNEIRIVNCISCSRVNPLLHIIGQTQKPYLHYPRARRSRKFLHQLTGPDKRCEALGQVPTAATSSNSLGNFRVSVHSLDGIRNRQRQHQQRRVDGSGTPLVFGNRVTGLRNAVATAVWPQAIPADEKEFFSQVVACFPHGTDSCAWIALTHVPHISACDIYYLLI